MSPATITSQFVNQIMSSLTTATQNCATFLQNNQDISIICDPTLFKQYPGMQAVCNGPVVISGVDMTQYAQLNATCVQNATTGADFASQLANNINNGVQQIIQNAGLNSSDQATLTQLCTNIGNTISQVFTQNCVNQIINNQEILVENRTGSINITAINMNQSIDAISQCVLQTSSVANSIQQLTNFLNQAAGGSGSGGAGSGSGSGSGTNNNNSTSNFLQQYWLYILGAILGIVFIGFLFYTYS